eukprot:TRINITY_DN71741_c0_g1_i1.p1 TRINITY_DN71741_c0_g1~~TRINITY_DN71741_c0_g1_i1.p1  ORF type:complete len:573 (+),score=141.48 TRINITY_DN71741_c0_g1_i1:113-1831(+)
MGLLKELQRISIFRRSSTCAKGSPEPKPAAEAAQARPLPAAASPAAAATTPAPEPALKSVEAPAAEVETEQLLQPRSPVSVASSASVEILEAGFKLGSDAPAAADAAAPEAHERPKAESSGEALSFDAPLEQVYAGIAEEYGPMIASSLRSNKWDKRTQALREIASVLRGLDLNRIAAPGSTGALGAGLQSRDSLRCWRLSCQLLCHIVKDKVMPVRLAAYELLQDTFVAAEDVVSEEEIRQAGAVLIENVLDRLGDSNVRLHESARRCVLFLAEHPGVLGLGPVLARLRSRLSAGGGESAKQTSKPGKEASKMYFGVLDATNFLLSRFPTTQAGSKASTCASVGDEARSEEPSWRLEDVSGLIIAGLADDALGQRVRTAAASLAVTVYKAFGAEAMEPTLAELRPAKQAFLRKQFEEFDSKGDSAEGEQRLLNTTNGSRRGTFNDLLVAGAPMKLPPGYTLPPLVSSPGVDFEPDEEEVLMDGILEEAGMVFNGLALFNEDSPAAHMRAAMAAGVAPSQFGLDMRDEEQRLLEEELINMGIDLESLDEQQALLSSLQKDDRGRNQLRLEVF